AGISKGARDTDRSVLHRLGHRSRRRLGEAGDGETRHEVTRCGLGAEEGNDLDLVHAETVGQIGRKTAASRHEAVTIHGERYPGRSQLTHERERRHTATSAIPSATAGCTRYAGDPGRPG